MMRRMALARIKPEAGHKRGNAHRWHPRAERKEAANKARRVEDRHAADLRHVAELREDAQAFRKLAEAEECERSIREAGLPCARCQSRTAEREVAG